MKLDNFIQNFSRRAQVEANKDPQLQSTEKWRKWVHNHSTLVKVIEVAGLILGLASIAAAPAAFILLGPVALLIPIAGTALVAISYLAMTKLHLLLSTAHSMKNHTFKPATFGAGRLYYQGNIPILELKSDDPYKAGEAHGYLLGAQLHRTLQTLHTVNKSSLNPHRTPSPASIPHVMKTLRAQIPEDYLREMQGLVDGYNKWAKGGFLRRAGKVTLDDLILMHMKPDSLHFQGFDSAHAAQPQLASIHPLGCTVAIDKDAKEGIIFGRNMDWPSLNIFGSHTLIINRKYSGHKQSTVEVGLPGFVGTLTGMNKQGLSLAMNVCSGNTRKIEGMPAAFYNRYCLENCKTVQDVAARVAEKHPLGDYHLSAADTNHAIAFHFNQGDRNGPQKHVVREWDQAAPLVVTNCRYQADGCASARSHMFFSKEREELFKRLINEAKETLTPQELSMDKVIAAGLALPYINNTLTTHKVVMLPQSRKMRVAFDNAFAGKRPLHDLDTAALFV
ncbi:MAG: C45 family autoproteolytic acyltransferase/hydrolase [Parachlamydia sp.]|nr:C45 family autoproteolytic acyltransferase/hydrolase [Parachlamydia sp.]